MKKKKNRIARPKRTKLIVTNRELVQVTLQIFKDQKEALEKQAKIKHEGRLGTKQGIIRNILDQQGLCNTQLAGAI